MLAIKANYQNGIITFLDGDIETTLKSIVDWNKAFITQSTSE